MPGIFGIVDKTRSSSDITRGCHRRAMELMASAMMYESSYTCSRLEVPDLGVYAGLIGRGDEFHAGAPVIGESHRISMLVTGEPVIEDRRIGAGCDDADRRALQRAIQAYDHSPETFPAAAVDSCSGLLVDETRGSALLFNDRCGMERVFVYENDERFVFSSEVKAILAVVPASRKFDPAGLAEFLGAGCTFGEQSLFSGIRVLPASTVVHLGGGAPRVRRYFDPAVWEELPRLAEAEFLDGLSEALDRAVRADTAPRGRVALSLTGGLDSRMIIAATNASDGAVPCYTFGSMYRETYDVRVARAIARSCRQPHHVLVLDNQFLRECHHWLERAIVISDGYLGLSGAAELYLNRLARSIAPVRVTGNYGGELLRAFRAFKSSMPRGDFLAPEMARRVSEAGDAFAVMDRMPPLSFTLFCQAPSGYGRYAIERSQVAVRSPFLDNRVVPFLYQSPGQFTKGNEPSALLVGRHRPDLLAIATDRGLLGRGGRLRRGAVRAYREILFRAEYWTGHGATHGIAALTRRRPGQLVERLFVGRHKFLHPRIWMRGRLGEYVQEVLTGSDSEVFGAFCKTGAVNRMLREHMQGTGNYWEELDRLLTIAVTHRLLLKQCAGVADSHRLS